MTAAKPVPYENASSGAQARERALDQGLIAINSILRDWVKGQVTAVECGILSVEAVFMPHMLTASGETVIEHVNKHGLLPAPKEAGNV